MKIYIQEKSKAEINRRLEKGDTIEGVEYNAFNPLGYMTDHILNECKSGTTVAIFEKYQDGNPISKSWGTWNKDKNKLT
jgi:hypothetical protein